MRGERVVPVVAKMVLHLKHGFLFALVRLNRNVEGVVSFLRQWNQARVGGESTGSRCRRTVQLRVCREHDFKCVAAVLRLWRQARVAYEIPFMHAQQCRAAASTRSISASMPTPSTFAATS